MNAQQLAENKKLWESRSPGSTWKPCLQERFNVLTGRVEKRSLSEDREPGEWTGYSASDTPAQEKPLMCAMPDCGEPRGDGFYTCSVHRKYNYLFRADGSLDPDAELPEPDSL
jgi:hypothetical protein